MYADDNKFEKQVQEKLQELKFSPPAPVWNNIESRLDLKSRRRSFQLIAGSFIAAILAVGGYLIFSPETVSYKANNSTLLNTSDLNSSSANDRKLPSGKGSENNTEGQKNSILPEDQHTDNKGQSNQEGNDMKPSVASRQGIDKSGVTLGGQQSLQAGETAVINKATAHSNSGKKIANASGRVAWPSYNSHKGGLAGVSNSSASPAGEVENNKTVSPSTELSNDNEQNSQQQKPLLAADIDPADNSTHINAMRPDIKDMHWKTAGSTVLKQKKWSLEVNAGAGQSILNSGNVHKLFTAASPTILNNVSFAPPGTSLWVASIKPSEVRPGKSFSAGLDVRYRISTRLGVTAGLNYNQLTTLMKTGAEEEKTITIQQRDRRKYIHHYFKAGVTNDYVNRYHFIALPLLMHAQLNRGKKLPLYFDGGVSVAYLLATNAAHYDGNANVYYQDIGLFNRTLVNAEGGISAKLFARKAFAFIVGPEISYGISDLFNNTVQNDGKHALFIGLKASLPILSF